LGKVQQTATKLVKGLKQKPHAERLARLHTTPLEKRRTREDLIHGGWYGQQGHRLKLKVQRCGLQVGQNFFSCEDCEPTEQATGVCCGGFLLLMCSRRDWMTGLQMWIFKALHLIHYITSYKLNTKCTCTVNLHRMTRNNVQQSKQFN